MEAVLSDREAAAPITAATEKISTSLPFSVTIFFHSLPAAVPAFRFWAELRAVPARVRILPIPCGSIFWMRPKALKKALIINGKNINVKIPAGTEDGQTLRLKGLGYEGFNGGANGDVLITVNVDRHPYFSSEGLNILLDLPITVKEAIHGAKITVPTISGKVVVNIPPYASSGEKLRLKGKGIKSRNGPGGSVHNAPYRGSESQKRRIGKGSGRNAG